MAFLMDDPMGSDFLNTIGRPDIEEERRRRMLQLQQIMQPQLPGPQAMAPSEEPFSALPEPIRRVLQERYSPEAEARRKRMAAETPDVIAQRMYQQYWGDPKSKAGKVGQAVLQIASGALGAPQPDFRGQAMKQFAAQQQVLQGEDANDSKAVVGALNAWAKDRGTDAAKQKADADRELKAQELFVRQSLGEEKNRISALIAAGLIDKNKADAMYAEAKTKQLNNPIYQAHLLRNPAGTASMLEQIDKEAADAFKRNVVAYEETKNAKEGTPGKTTTSVGQRMVEGTAADGSTYKKMVPVTTTSTSGGTPGNGLNRRAFAEGVSQAPVAQGAPAPTMQQPTPAQAPPMLAVPPRAGAAPRAQAPPPVDKWLDGGTPIGDEVTFASGGSNDGPAIQSREFYPGQIPGSRKYPPAVQKEKEAVKKRFSFTGTMLGLTEKAARDGSLAKTVGFGNNPFDAIRPGLTQDFRRALGSENSDARFGDVATYLNTMQIASYLKEVSGAQVAEAEYKRLSSTYSKMTDKPSTFIRFAYVQDVVPRVLTYMAERGMFADGKMTQAEIGGFLDKKIQQYGWLMDRLVGKGKLSDAEQKELDRLKSIPKLALEAAQGKYPGGADFQVDLAGGNGYIRTRIPHTIPEMEKVKRTDEKEKLRKELQDATRGM